MATIETADAPTLRAALIDANRRLGMVDGLIREAREKQIEACAAIALRRGHGPCYGEIMQLKDRLNGSGF